MTISSRETFFQQLGANITFAGQSVLNAVGYGRGNAKKMTYIEALALQLATQLEQKASLPMKIVMNWQVEIEIAGGVLEDSGLPLVIALPSRGTEIVHVSEPFLAAMPPQIEHIDMSQLSPPDIELLPLMPIFVNVSSQKKPFNKEFIRNAQHLSERIGAAYYGLLNFGKPQIRYFFPKTVQDDLVKFPQSPGQSSSQVTKLEDGGGEQATTEEKLIRSPERSTPPIAITDVKLPSDQKTN